MTYTYSSLTDGACTLGKRNQEKKGETRSSWASANANDGFSMKWYTSWKH